MQNKRVSEWAHFLNLFKWFRRSLNFSAPKNEVFLEKTEREIACLKWVQKEGFWRLFNNFLGISAYNFVKNNPTFENKNLFDAKRYGA